MSSAPSGTPCRIVTVIGASICIAFLATHRAPAQTWSNAQLLNLPAEGPQGAIKKPDVCRAAGGGFHVVYRHHLSGSTPMKYRRYFNGNLGSMVVAAPVPNYAWDEYIAEAGNGDVHITWENWDATPDSGWTRSTNGGASFAPAIELTSFPGSAKAPRIARIGPASGPDMLLVVTNPDDNRVYSSRFNGSSWSGAVSSGIATPGNTDQIFGICTSPVDGSVYAGNGNGNRTPSLLHFTSFWSSIDLENVGSYFARQSVAVNSAGEVMYCWEVNSAWYSKLWSPSTGWGATQTVRNPASFGSVIAIPGTTSFYTAYAQGKDPTARIRGKLWSGGAWGAEETISVNQADAQSLDARVAVGTDGSMFCCWEYWGSGNAQAYYSVRSAPAPLPTGTIAGVVRDQFGAGVSSVAISTTGAVSGASGAGGAYSFSSPVGTFFVTAVKAAYNGQTHSNVAVTQGQTTALDFVITGQPPAAVSGLVVTSSTSAANSLQWTTPSSAQFNGTRIIYRTDHTPTSPTDGTVAIDDVGMPNDTRTFTHTGLTNGTTYYYAAYAYFQDASRFYSSAVNAAATPAVAADFDRDGDVDQLDFGHFQACLSGAQIPQPIAACRDANLNRDPNVVVDAGDLGVFLNCARGADVPVDPQCAD